MLFALDYVWLDGQFAVIFDNGDVEFYSDGDMRLSLKTLDKFCRLAHRKVYLHDRSLS